MPQVTKRTAMLFSISICLLAAAHAEFATAADDAEKLAATILEETGVRGGIIVHLGCGNGELTAALRANESFQVHGLDRDWESVEAARKHIQSLDLYGPVAADKLTTEKQLPYIDNLVNLVIAEELDGIPMKEVLRVLVPNGVAYIKNADGWAKTVKPRPKNIDEWTHYMHSASNNAVAHDDVVGPPRHLQWIGSPRWSRHHDRMASVSAMVSSGGRVYYIMDEGSRISIQLPSKWTLIARDAFNGTVLWKRPIPAWQHHLWPLKSGPTHLARRLVAVDDRVYITLGINAAVSVLDGATGETIHELAGSDGTEELIVSGPNVYALVNKGKSELADYKPAHNVGDQARVRKEFHWNEQPRELMAFDTETGRELWKKQSKVAPLTISSDGERLFYHDGEKVVARDRANGEEEWHSAPVDRRQQLQFNFGPKLVIHDDVLLFAGGDREMHAFNTKTGKEMWTAPHARGGYESPEDLLVSSGLVWSAATTSTRDDGVWRGLDMRTGKVKKEFAPNVDTYWFHHRCYIAKATDNFILPSRTGVEFVNPDQQDWEIHHWVRGGCLYGVMPCNGLLYSPPHNCACYPEAKMYGLNALAPTGNSSIGALLKNAPLGEMGDRLEQHEVGRVSNPFVTDAWPTYRRNNARSGATTNKISADVTQSWQTTLGGKLSAVTIADSKLFVAEVDEHQVTAVDANSGKPLWNYIAGARVDSPPTFHKGDVYFGSADGYVYCVTADEGKLRWRFRAAPVDLRHGVMEQLESVWPVHGSVLVTEREASGQSEVSFIAGRSLYLDGGMRLIKLNAATGELVDEDLLDDRDPETGKNLQTRLKVLQMPVGLSDILSSDGKHRYMRSQPFDAEGKRFDVGPYSADFAGHASVQRGETAHLFAPMGFLDDTYFHRAYWVFGRSFAGGHGGYFQAGKYAPSGRLLVHDDENVYGFARKPQYYKWTTTIEHQLFRTSKTPPPQARDAGDSTVAGNKNARRNAPVGNTGMIHVAKSKSLDPTGKSLAVSAWVNAEKPNGVIVAQGGPARGFALWIEKGTPKFTVREGEDKSVTATAGARIGGKWVHLCGVLTPEMHVQLFVNGRLADDAGEIPLITSDPVQPLEIGGDDAGAVGAYQSPNLLTGTIDEVVVLHGKVTVDDVQKLMQARYDALSDDAHVVLQLALDNDKTIDASQHKNKATNQGAKTAEGHIGRAMRFAGTAKNKGGGARGIGSFVQHQWNTDIPLIVQAIVKAGDVLFVCGPPDMIDEEASFAKIMAGDTSVEKLLTSQDAAFNGADGAILLAVDANTGKTLATHKLKELPVWDSLAVADGKLYLTTTQGNVLCFTGN